MYCHGAVPREFTAHMLFNKLDFFDCGTTAKPVGDLVIYFSGCFLLVVLKEEHRAGYRKTCINNSILTRSTEVVVEPTQQDCAHNNAGMYS
jgi:hypothetical protein